MHNSSKQRMKWFEEKYSSKIEKDKVKVLDVGSYDVNGSYKEFFNNKKYEYFGLDIENGPNVDIVTKSAYDWSNVETESFDVIISGQAFEHVEFFWITISEMARVLKKDGLLCIIAPNGFKEHRYPVDCYRFFSDGMVAMARYVNLEPIHSHTNCAPNIKLTEWYSEENADSMLVAKKPYSGLPIYIDVKNYKCIPPDQEKLKSGLVPAKASLNNTVMTFFKRIKNRLTRNK